MGGNGSISPESAEILKVTGRCRVNVLISGGIDSGKTTLLNCLTRYVDNDERIVTCEDAVELQLQQPHVVRLETRPPNLEAKARSPCAIWCAIVCDAHLPDGSRVNAIVSPLAIGGPALTIRKFRKDKLTPEQFFRYDAARTYHRR